MKTNVPINTPEEIAQSLIAGTLAAEVLAMITPHVKALALSCNGRRHSG